MDEPTDEPTGTTAELVPQDSGSEVFYLALIGAIAGMIAGGVFGLITDNSGLKQIDNPIIFMSAVAVAAVVLGMLASEAWGAVIGAVTRSGAATHEEFDESRGRHRVGRGGDAPHARRTASGRTDRAAVDRASHRTHLGRDRPTPPALGMGHREVRSAGPGWPLLGAESRGRDRSQSPATLRCRCAG